MCLQIVHLSYNWTTQQKMFSQNWATHLTFVKVLHMKTDAWWQLHCWNCRLCLFKKAEKWLDPTFWVWIAAGRAIITILLTIIFSITTSFYSAFPWSLIFWEIQNEITLKIWLFPVLKSSCSPPPNFITSTDNFFRNPAHRQSQTQKEWQIPSTSWRSSSKSKCRNC